MEYLYKHHQKWDVYQEWYQKFSDKFVKQNKWKKEPGHSYDLALVQLGKIAFIEVDGEKHSKNNQKINDGIAEKYAKEELKAIMIRLDKVECNGTLEDRTKVFKKAFEVLK